LQQLEGIDRLSTLTDDILLSILGRVTSRMAARTSVLSMRWMHLPWLLPEISINVKEFLSGPCRDPAEENDMSQAMASLTKATRSFLAKPRKGSSISSLRLQLYLINTFLCDIGPIVGDASNSGLLKDLDLTIHDEIGPLDRTEEEMIQRAQEMDVFFTANPNVLRCLTRLCLFNVCFGKLDINHILSDCCKQLRHLSLFHSDTGDCTPCKIDAPNSKLSVLQIHTCRFERLELICLPKLEKLEWDTWLSVYAPLSLGFVPSLGELNLSNGRTVDHRGFKLSEVLDGATSIHTLTLDFQGENVSISPFSIFFWYLLQCVFSMWYYWITSMFVLLTNICSYFSSHDQLWMPLQIKELRPAFSKIRKLSVCGIFVDFDIEWTIAFLEVAPFVELLLIGVTSVVSDF
jgi:hypothetical protein